MESESCDVFATDFKSPVATLTFDVEEVFVETIRVIFVTSCAAALQSGLSTASSRSRLNGRYKSENKMGIDIDCYMVTIDLQPNLKVCVLKFPENASIQSKSSQIVQ